MHTLLAIVKSEQCLQILRRWRPLNCNFTDFIGHIVCFIAFTLHELNIKLDKIKYPGSVHIFQAPNRIWQVSHFWKDERTCLLGWGACVGGNIPCVFRELIECLFLFGQADNIGWFRTLADIVSNHLRKLVRRHGISVSFRIHRTIWLCTVFFQQETGNERRKVTDGKAKSGFQVIVNFTNWNLTVTLEGIFNHLVNRFLYDDDMLTCKRLVLPIFFLAPEFAQNGLFTSGNQTLDFHYAHTVFCNGLRSSELQLSFGKALCKVLYMLESIQDNRLQNSLNSASAGCFFTVLICIGKDDELSVVNTLLPITLQYIFCLFCIFFWLLSVVAIVIHWHSGVVYILLKSF